MAGMGASERSRAGSEGVGGGGLARTEEEGEEREGVGETGRWRSHGGSGAPTGLLGEKHHKGRHPPPPPPSLSLLPL